MSASLGSSDRALRVAVVGSGPSGFYAAETLLAANLNIEVDIFDRLPSPYGLVRYGVAPDHPKIKNVIKIYEKIAAHPKFAFFGNVGIDRDVTVADLKKFYDVILFTCGTETDKHLGIPGEELEDSHTATEFVGWYNGHPDYQARKFDLSRPVAVVVGLGNVAMDVARILGKTVEELKATDITQNALNVLAKSKIKEIHVIGRRGPVQSAFSPAEIKEFGELHDCDIVIDPQDLVLNDASQKELNDPTHPVRKKNFDILQKFSQTPLGNKSRKVVFHFLKSPVEIKGKGKIESIVLEKNKLSGEAGKQSAKGTGEKEELKCGNVFRSVGYRGLPIAGTCFDEAKGIFQNEAGRLVEKGKVLSGLYSAGWIKRGPTGIIGTNKADSDETVKHILADVSKLTGAPSPKREDVEKFLQSKKIRYVTFADWKKVDAAEISRGTPVGKPREKFLTVEEMLKAAGR